MDSKTEGYQRLIGALLGDKGLQTFNFTEAQASELTAICDELITRVSIGGRFDGSRAKEIIDRRFGINTPKQTYESLATHFKVPTTRIKQIEAKLRWMMKHPLRIFALKTFLARLELCEYPPIIQVALIEELRAKVYLGIALSEEEIAAVGMAGLELSVRTQNGLRNEGITTLAELRRKSKWQLLRIPNFGRKCLAEIEDIIAEFGITLADE